MSRQGKAPSRSRKGRVREQVLSVEEATEKLGEFFQSRDHAVAFFKALAKGHEARVKAFEKNLNADFDLQRRLVTDPVPTLAMAGILNADSPGGVHFHLTGHLVDIARGLRISPACRWELTCETCFRARFEDGSLSEITSHLCECSFEYTCS